MGEGESGREETGNGEKGIPLVTATGCKYTKLGDESDRAWSVDLPLCMVFLCDCVATVIGHPLTHWSAPADRRSSS